MSWMDTPADAHNRQFLREDEVLDGLLGTTEISGGIPDAQQRGLDLGGHVFEPLDNLLLDTFRDFAGEQIDSLGDFGTGARLDRPWIGCARLPN